MVINGSRSASGRSGALRWRGTVKRTVYAMRVVIIRERVQLPRQVNRVPEEQVIAIFAADGANQPFMNGCETGAYGTDLTSSIARTRKLANHRWKRNSGS